MAGALLGLSLRAGVTKVEILRDSWGIPHVFAETDAGAFYGLGYATAEDRAFQMTYSLRIVQGRLSEVVGEVRQANRRETSLDHDRKMRTFGFHRAAQRTAANLDAPTLALLQSYCDGVNRFFHEHRDSLHPLFARTGLVPEPWTPADCVASWWHLGQFFATDGTRDLIAGRNATTPREPDRSAQRGSGARGVDRGRGRPVAPPGLKPLPPDEAPAVVQRGDVPVDWVEQVGRYAQEHGLRSGAEGAEGPKFSHAWVVGGTRTTTGSSVLVSDPQTPVRNPPLFYEFHVQGRSFNARGIGVPGSPILLIGFSDHVAWGVTALGADQADLFQLETSPEHPDHYRFDGEWRPMTLHREVLRIRGRDPIETLVRETHLGPVATAFCFAQPSEGEVALKRIPLCETRRETIQAALAMVRARNAREFNAALAGWQFPSANAVFGDREGHIGYRAVAAIPVRSRLDATCGRTAQPGHRQAQDWQEIAPSELLPGVMNPAAGFVYSANHRPVGSWYPIPLGAMTGAGGDTLRSWRLREILDAHDRFTPEDVLALHFDAVNPARRDIVRLGLHCRDGLKRPLSEEASQALIRLEPWFRAGASSSLTREGAALAMEINTFFRLMSTDLAYVYGGGESGLAYFLKTATARIRQDPQAGLSDLEQEFIERSLASAWQSASQKYGPDPAQWAIRARKALEQQRLGYYESLDGFPALEPVEAVGLPALTKPDGGTIGCQTAQSYTQWVPMHDPDQALSLLPIGQSERPGHPSRTSTLGLWVEGRLHPAPLSRAAVDKLAVSRVMLEAVGESSGTSRGVPGAEEPLPSDLGLIPGPVNGAFIERDGSRLAIYGDPTGQGPAPDMVLLTEARRDATWAARDLARRGVEVVAPEREAEWLNHPEQFWADLREKRFHDYAQQTTKVPVEPMPVSRMIKGGDRIPWKGLSIRVLDTPGYTRGAVSYLVEIGGKCVAFTGDLIRDDGKLQDLFSLQDAIPEAKIGGYHGWAGRLGDVMTSLDRIAAEKPDLLVPLRGPVIRDPAAAVDRLKGRIRAVYANYLSVDALRWYFGDGHIQAKAQRVLGTGARVDGMPMAETLPLPEAILPISNSRLILAADRSGFLVDCGGNGIVDELRKLRAAGRLMTVEHVFVTHYHDDHTDALPALVREFGARVHACGSLVDRIERPADYRLPCLTKNPTAVTAKHRDGDTWQWKEFRFTILDHPGQTLHHNALRVEHAGDWSVFFAGDSFTPSGIDDYCLQNRNILHEGKGYFRCLDQLEQLPTGCLVVNQHVEPAFRFSPAQVAQMRETLRRRIPLLGALLPFDDPNYGLDESWAGFQPYWMTVHPGESARVAMRITNHSPRERVYRVQARVPEGFQVTGADAVRMPAGGEGFLPLTVQVADTAAPGLHVLLSDVGWEDVTFREWTEAVIEVVP